MLDPSGLPSLEPRREAGGGSEGYAVFAIFPVVFGVNLPDPAKDAGSTDSAEKSRCEIIWSTQET